MNCQDPIFFMPNRVWRCYLGGVLLDRFRGLQAGKDGHVPEDWLASDVRAINGDHSQGPDEGLARILNPDGTGGPRISEVLEKDAAAVLGPLHSARYGKSMAILCKYLDSAIRLPIQCHPDVPLARKFYNSPYGKTESWYILDTRKINGQEPYLLMGFKPGVTREQFARTIETQNSSGMESLLHKVHCKPGEMYFIPGRLPHAVGPGVFMLEIQEPTDWIINFEKKCADTVFSEREMWGPVTPEQALDIVDLAGLTEEQTLKKVHTPEQAMTENKEGRVAELIGPKQTTAFGVHRATITGRMTIRLPREFGIVVVADGQGEMKWAHGQKKIRRGDYFLQPVGVTEIEYEAQTPLSLVFCLPPSPQS